MRRLEDYQKELTRVKEILRANHRGMTVTDISREININRNSVAKYLDVLLISGQVDMKRMGPAKAYFLSHRVPISAMLNFSSDYIIAFNSHLEMVQVNDIFLDLINVERDNVVGRKWSEAPPDIFNDPDITTGLQKGLEGKDSTIDKMLQVRGTDLHFHIKFVPATFQDGSLGVTLIMENITERKMMEIAVRESEERLHTICSNMTDIVCTMDLELNFTMISASIESILSYTVEEAMNMKLDDFFTHSSYELAMHALREELEKEETGQEDPSRTRTLELELIHKNGSPVMTEVKITFLRDLNGKPIEILCVARDLTEHLRYGDKLEALHSHAINLALASNIEEIAKTTLDAIEMIFRIEDLEFIIAKDETLQLVDRKGPGTPVRTVIHFDGAGIITKAARTKSSVLVPDVRRDPDYFKARTRTLSEIAVPVKIEGDLLAILNLESPQEGAFTLEDQKLLEIFAGHVASAMRRIGSS